MLGLFALVRIISCFVGICIEDSGTGIDAEILPTMFELYKTTKKEGLGVSLWLRKTIISKHHGEISATNIPSGGALFIIQIPLVQTTHEKT
jgi:signal transduction histidine kinase